MPGVCFDERRVVEGRREALCGVNEECDCVRCVYVQMCVCVCVCVTPLCCFQEVKRIDDEQARKWVKKERK